MTNPILDFFINVGLGLFIIATIVIFINVATKTAYLIAGSPTDKAMLEEKVKQLSYCEALVRKYEKENKELEKQLKATIKEIKRLRKEYDEISRSCENPS